MAAESFDDVEIAAISHAFPTFIDKTHDVRVTVAGPSVFGVAIRSTSQSGRADGVRTTTHCTYSTPTTPSPTTPSPTTTPPQHGTPGCPASIIATCAVADIPLAWTTQLAPGGSMLVNLRGEIAGATLCLLTKDTTGDDEVIGPFLAIPGHFMWARHTTTPCATLRHSSYL